MITVNLLFIVTILAGALALVDGIARVRGRGGATILAVAEIIFAALLLVALFVAFPNPFGLLTWATLLLIVLVITLILRGGRRGVWLITVIALILTAIVVLVGLGWLSIPGLF